MVVAAASCLCPSPLLLEVCPAACALAAPAPVLAGLLAHSRPFSLQCQAPCSLFLSLVCLRGCLPPSAGSGAVALFPPVARMISPVALPSSRGRRRVCVSRSIHHRPSLCLAVAPLAPSVDMLLDDYVFAPSAPFTRGASVQRCLWPRVKQAVTGEASKKGGSIWDGVRWDGRGKPSALRNAA